MACLQSLIQNLEDKHHEKATHKEEHQVDWEQRKAAWHKLVHQYNTMFSTLTLELMTWCMKWATSHLSAHSKASPPWLPRGC